MTDKVGTLSDFDRADQKIMRLVFAMLCFVLCLVALHQFRSAPTVVLSEPPIVRQNTVFLHGDITTGTTIKDAQGAELTFLPHGQGGFLETLATVIKRGRIQSGTSQDAPIIARLHSQTHLTVLDPETGQVYNLSSYGRDNIDHLITHLLPEMQG